MAQEFSHLIKNLKHKNRGKPDYDDQGPSIFAFTKDAISLPNVLQVIAKFSILSISSSTAFGFP